jgi:hypothetical protein
LRLNSVRDERAGNIVPDAEGNDGSFIQRHSKETNNVRKVGAMNLRILSMASTKTMSRSLAFVDRVFAGLVKENIEGILNRPEIPVEPGLSSGLSIATTSSSLEMKRKATPRKRGRVLSRTEANDTAWRVL